ncbi:FHA domain-containing protein [Planctomycetota bacterium]
MIRLTIEAEADPFVYDYEGDERLTVGRSSSCELTVKHKDVSRKQFEIVPGRTGFTLRDLCSRNGTKLNGQKIDEAELSPGDLIEIGTRVRIRFGEPPPRQSVAASDQEIGSSPPGTPRPSEHGQPRVMSEPTSADEEREPKVDESDEPERASATDGDAAPPHAPRKRRRRFGRAHKGSTSAVAIYVGLALLLLVLAVAAKKLVLDPMEASSPKPPQDAVARLDTDRSESRTEPRAMEPSAPSGAELAWKRLESMRLEPDLLVAALEDLADRYPGTVWASRAKARAEVLKLVRSGDATGSAGALAALEGEIERLLTSRRFLEAYYLAETAPRLRLADKDTARRLRERVSGRAYDHFSRIRDRARALTQAAKALEAYELLANEGIGLLRLPFGVEVEAERVSVREALQRQLQTGAKQEVVSAEVVQDRAELEMLTPRASLALLACDFDKALSTYRKILTLSLTDTQRLEYQWKLYDARRARLLFQDLLAFLAQDPRSRPYPLLITVTQSWKGEVVDGDALGVRIRVNIPGEKTRPEMEKRWRDLAPVTLLEMFSGLELDGDGLLSLAALAFELGYEQEAHGALIRVVEEWRAYREEAATLLGRRTGRNVPVNSLVVFEGRLITGQEKETIVAARAAEKERSRALREQLALARKEGKAKRILEEALAMLRRGSFVEGKALLRAIAEKLPQSEIGKQARAHATDVFLRRRQLPLPVREDDTEPRGLFDSNRISVYFLGEGYQLDNAQQRSFDGVAQRAQKILVAAEPWKEYAGYFQYYAVNVESQDQGLDRTPGDVEKDTPFDGKVDGGVYQVSAGMVRSFLSRFPGPSIGVVLGNDNASVATGGGGACAVVKGMVDVCGHEIGHAFVALGDEYDSDPTGAPGPTGRAPQPLETRVIAANLIGGNQKEEMRKKAPWRHWIALGANNWTGQPVDLYEGGNQVPFDVWRPQRDCKMRTSSSRFCAPCMEQMLLGLYRGVRPIDEVSPKESVVEIAKGRSARLRIATLKPRSRFLEVQFELTEEQAPDEGEGTVVRKDEEKKKLSVRWVELPDGRVAYAATAKELGPGRYKVSVTVKDPTPWVAQQDRTLLEQTHTWSVRVAE